MCFFRGKRAREQTLGALFYHQQQLFVISLRHVRGFLQAHLQHLRWLEESGRQHGYTLAIRGCFLRLHLHDKTYFRVFLHMPGRWSQSRSSDNVLAMMGWPC